MGKNKSKPHDMEFVFIDESGDNGSKGSKHLIVTTMCIRSKKRIIKVIRDAKKRLLSKNKLARWLNKNGGEIKYSCFPDEILLKRTLNNLAKEDITIHYIVFKKNNIHVTPDIKKNILALLFYHVHVSKNHKLPNKIIADLDFVGKKKTSCFIAEESIIDKETNEREIIVYPLDNNKKGDIAQNEKRSVFCIEHQRSSLREELQAVDLISGVIFRKYEYGDDSLYNIISNKIEKYDIFDLNKKENHNTHPTRQTPPH